jgi:hypothetical protein
VIGHVAEVLPFMFQRLDVMPMAMTKLRPRVSAYLRDNVHSVPPITPQVFAADPPPLQTGAFFCALVFKVLIGS